MNSDRFLSVSELNSAIKERFENDSFLRHLTIKGEISSYKAYPTAVYFDIKDSKSSLSCFMWSQDAIYLSFEPKVGDEVIVEGRMDVYVPRGRYQLVAKSITPYGEGAALLALQELKKKLEREGLFSSDRKRELPSFPKTIGIIVGKRSAAEADLVKNLGRRWPLSDIIVFPSLVQGTEAPKSLIKAIDLAERYPIDVLIIARGGGSNEDLNAFNDEAFVRKVASFKSPTISAVGHEIDFTLTDFAADKRVSTPTAAAELAVPDQNEICMMLSESSDSIDRHIDQRLKAYRDKLDSLSNRPFFKNPRAIYEISFQKIDDFSSRLDKAITFQLSKEESSLKELSRALDSLSPKAVLERGYSITSDENGKIIRSVKDAKSGATLKTKLKDGIITSLVKGEN